MLDDAYEQLARSGPAVDGRTISLTGVAKALGTSRTNLYRRWPTASDLALDIAVFRSTPDDGWHAEVCDDDGGPLADALRRTLAGPASAHGVLTRASVATWRESPARHRLAAWERAHLAGLAARLRREWGDRAAGPWTDIAVAIASLMDGMHLMCAQFADELGAPMPADLAEETIQTALRIVEFLLTHAAGPDRPIASVGGTDVPDDGLPPRLAEALVDGSLAVAPDGSRRVVDMGVLARARRVSERSLYARWPTATELNADLFLESVSRVRGAFARVLLEVFQSNVGGGFTNAMPLIARMNDWFMDPTRFPEATVHLALVDVLSQPEVLDRVREPVQVGLQYADLQTAAILQATGYRLRPDIRMRTYTLFIVGMGMGSHRTSATHPELLDHRLGYLGEEHPASGVGHTALTRSCTEPLDPAAEASHPTEPPLPPALRPREGT